MRIIFVLLRYLPRLLSLTNVTVMSLKAMNIRAEMLTSTVNKTKQKDIMTDLSSQKPKTKFLYLTPEKIAKSNALMR